jgi:putative membrane protein
VTGHAQGGAGGPLLVAVLACAYEWQSLRVPGWDRWRGAAFMTGCAVLTAALAVPVHDFAGHMTQHLLAAMVAPLGLVLGAPVTLLLRAWRPGSARRLTRVLRTRPARLLAHPVTALALTVGTLGLLYLTPLYAAALRNPALHDLVLLHVVLSGCLFAWVIAGPDPAPHRPAVRVRLITLGVAVLAHATLSQLLFAGAYMHIPATVADRQAGATIMYYGGDVAELLLAFALVQSRTAPRGRRLAHVPPDAALRAPVHEG